MTEKIIKHNKEEEEEEETMTTNSRCNLFESTCNILLFTSVGFLLGMLFLILSTDYELLYTNRGITEEVLFRVEQTYIILWSSPLIIKSILHIILILPILILSIKLSRYTESAIYFDGLSLGLMLLLLGVYSGSTLPNLRSLSHSTHHPSLQNLMQNSFSLNILKQISQSQSHQINIFYKILSFLSYPSIYLINSKKVEKNSDSKEGEEGNKINRNELLSVTAAGHSIALVLLFGIVFLQIGKVYAEFVDFKLKKKFKLDQKQKQKIKDN